MVAQDFCHFLGLVFRRTANWIRSHNLAHFHFLPPLLRSAWNRSCSCHSRLESAVNEKRSRNASCSAFKSWSFTCRGASPPTTVQWHTQGSMLSRRTKVPG